MNKYQFKALNKKTGKLITITGIGEDQNHAYSNALEQLEIVFDSDFCIIDNHKSINKYWLVDYFDVWGNAEEGWDVNDVSINKSEEFHILNDASDKDIVALLVNIGFIKDIPNIDQLITIESYSEDMIEIYETETMKPLGRLEKVH